MRVTLDGSLISVVHNSWSESEWQGRKRPAGSETVAYVDVGFDVKPERVVLSPELAGRMSDPRFAGHRFEFAGDLRRGRFGPELEVTDIRELEAETLSLAASGE